MSSPDHPVAPARSRKQRQRDELINTSVRAALHPSRPGGAALWTGVLLAALWVLVVANSLDDHHLSQHLGIRPRQAHGLWGLLSSPLFHADASQLAANSIPFAAMCWLMMWSGLGMFAVVTAITWLASGGVDWLVGPAHANITGVSGVVFGWMGYILARAVYGRSIRWIGIAIAVIFVFAGTFGGLLPGVQNHVYWGGHVAGFAAGVAAAAFAHRRRDSNAVGPGGKGRAGSTAIRRREKLR